MIKDSSFLIITCSHPYHCDQTLERTHEQRFPDRRPDTWFPLGSGLSNWRGDNYTYVHAIAASSEGIYLGGDFDTAGTQGSLGLARWGAPGVSGVIHATGGTLGSPDGTSVTFPAGVLPDGASVQYTALFVPTHAASAGMTILRSFTLFALTGPARSDEIKLYMPLIMR